MGTKTLLGIIVLLLVLVVSLFFVFTFRQTAEQALGQAGQACSTENPCQSGLICKDSACITPPSSIAKGKSATLNTVVFNKASLSSSQVATAIHLWAKPSATAPDSEYVRISSALQQSQTGAVEPVSASTGDHVKAIPFNRSTYYGKWKEFDVTKESLQVELDAYAMVVDNMTVTIFDENDQSMTMNAVNVTVSQNGEYTFSKHRYRQNNSQEVYVFGGLAFNTVEGTNLTITTGQAKHEDGTTSATAAAAKVVRLANRGDFVYKLATPIWLEDGDHLDVEDIKLETSGTACPATDEIIEVIILDWTDFEDRNSMPAQGFEDDASTPQDVGGRDQSYVIACSS